MDIRRFTFQFLTALMSMSFALSSHANTLLSATGTISCSDYSLSVSAIDLTVGAQYTIDYTFTVDSASSPVTISSSTTFQATASSQTVVVAATSMGPFTGSVTVTAASATLTSSGSKVSIVFSPSELVCNAATGRFTGGGRVIDVGALSVTTGLELDCDLMKPDTLEINWAQHRFHLETLKSAVCLLVGNPTPPVAPINEMIGKGEGRYDGAEGYSIAFTLIDNGEPGTKDKLAFMIYETANVKNVVLNLPLQLLTKGNLQAHFDQR